jgi:hypothetical protein
MEVTTTRGLCTTAVAADVTVDHAILEFYPQKGFLACERVFLAFCQF